MSHRHHCAEIHYSSTARSYYYHPRRLCDAHPEAVAVLLRPHAHLRRSHRLLGLPGWAVLDWLDCFSYIGRVRVEDCAHTTFDIGL